MPRIISPCCEEYARNTYREYEQATTKHVKQREQAVCRGNDNQIKSFKFTYNINQANNHIELNLRSAGGSSAYLLRFTRFAAVPDSFPLWGLQPGKPRKTVIVQSPASLFCFFTTFPPPTTYHHHRIPLFFSFLNQDHYAPLILSKISTIYQPAIRTYIPTTDGAHRCRHRPFRSKLK